MSAMCRVAKAALHDRQPGGESCGQRSAAEDVETFLPGAREQSGMRLCRMLHNAWSIPACRDRPRSGEAKVQHCSTVMTPARRKNRLSCSDLAAAICEGREQGCRKAIAFFGSGNGTETWIENNPGDESGWKRSL